MTLGFILLTTFLLGKTKGNYLCICNYNVEQSVLPYPDVQAIPLGYMYEFDCKSIVQVTDLNTQQWRAIAYLGQIGYLEANTNIQETMCPGFVSKEDILTTTESHGQLLSTMSVSTDMSLSSGKSDFSTSYSRYRSTVLPLVTTAGKSESAELSSYGTTTKKWSSKNFTSITLSALSSQRQYTTTSKNGASTSTTILNYQNRTTDFKIPASFTQLQTKNVTGSISTTNKDSTYPLTTLMTPAPFSQTPFINVYTLPTTNAPTLPPFIDDVSLCPPIILQYTREDEGALTQYGNKCYELVPFKLIWTKAELDCRAKGGHLLTVQTLEFRNFIYTWLKKFISIPAVWLGISDRRENGWFEWTSGEKLVSTYWVQESAFTNQYDNCGIMLLDDTSKGGWKSVSCGETTPKGDRGSQYAFICEYSTSTLSLGAGVIGR